MIANSAFLAAMVLLLLAFSLLGQLEFLAPYKRLIVADYLCVIVGALVVVFLNLFALFYLVGARACSSRRPAASWPIVEKQLRTGDTIVRDLSERLAGRTEAMSRDARDDSRTERPPGRRTTRADRGRVGPARQRVPMDGLALPRTGRAGARHRRRSRLPAARLRGADAGDRRRVPPRAGGSARRGSRCVSERGPPAPRCAGPDRAQDDHRQPRADAPWSC